MCSGNSAFTVGAAAMTAAGAVAASTRRKGRTSKAGTFSGRGLQASRHMGSISCHRLVIVETQVTARAEVAPGEKVVGIDLGTTNSAVAAMEVLEPTRYVWTFADVCG